MSILEGIKLKGEDVIHQLDYERGVGNKPTLIKSYDDLDDKPFYTEQGEMVELLPSQELEFINENGTFAHYFDTPFGLEKGKTYKVTFDGTVYETTCINAEPFEGAKFILIGNGAFATLEDTGEPFAVVEMYSNGVYVQCAIVSPIESTSHTVAIQKQEEIVHQLDSKYVNAYTKEETTNLIANAITTALNTEV